MPHLSLLHTCVLQVGSVQKVDEGSDALGILSCVNICAHSKRPSIQAISSELLRRCPKEQQSQIKHLLSSPTTALVVSSRILNVLIRALLKWFVCAVLKPFKVPDALALPLWKGLLEEISVARKVALFLRCKIDFTILFRLFIRQEMQIIKSARYYCCAQWSLATTDHRFTCGEKKRFSVQMLMCSSHFQVSIPPPPMRLLKSLQAQ